MNIVHIMFYLIEPKTGTVIEKAHDLEGKTVAGKALVFPGGKGSSVVQADGLYQLKIQGNMPAAMIIQHPETVLVYSAIIMKIPMVDKVEPEFYEILKFYYPKIELNENFRKPLKLEEIVKLFIDNKINLNEII